MILFNYQGEERGAGEILLNSIDHDGSARGYDLEQISTVVARSSIPIIACGGKRALAKAEIDVRL